MHLILWNLEEFVKYFQRAREVLGIALAALRHGPRGTRGSRDSSSATETVFVLSKGH